MKFTEIKKGWSVHLRMWELYFKTASAVFFNVIVNSLQPFASILHRAGTFGSSMVAGVSPPPREPFKRMNLLNNYNGFSVFTFRIMLATFDPTRTYEFVKFRV